MPELPEVETIRQDLRRKILSQKIKNVIINSDKVAGGKKARQELVNFLPGQSFAEVERIGKLLILEIKESPLFLLVHLKMTGQLIYAFHNQIIAGGHSFSPFPLSAVTTPSVLPLAKREKLSPSAREGARGEREQFLLPDKHTQVMITFENGGQLYFNDMRRFGYFKLADQATKEKIVASFGIEPLTKNFTLEAFPLLFKKRKTLLKALLLNQQLIAGIGNIYADEICHAAKVRPTRRVNTLTQEEIKRLYQACQAIIKKAIAFRGTTFNNYVDSEGNQGNFSRLLKVYEQDGKTCKTCKKSIIQKIHAAGRGTHFCPECQR